MGLFVLLSGCSDTPTPPADTSAADQKAIKDGEIAWNADWASHELDKIAGHYADDASLMLPDMPIITGKDAIRTGLKGLLSDKNFALSFVTDSVVTAKGGDLAYTRGTYLMIGTDPKTKKASTEKGKFVTVYKKQTDGLWKAVADIANSDAPAVSAAASTKKAAPAKARKKAPAHHKK